MLTRDLLRYRVRRGQVQPLFIDPHDPALQQQAADLLAVVYAAAAAGETRGDVDEALTDALSGGVDAQVARGLRKLVSDLCTYAEPCADAPRLRADAFAQSTRLLRELPLDATREAFCARLPNLPQLYDDLPEARTLVTAKALDAMTLLHRYNMAQVQGLVMASKHLRITTPGGDLRAVRRVLRWLKFCRLVAEVQKQDDGMWSIAITGPADIFEHAKKYSLQLAVFVPVVPLLSQHTVEAEIAMRPGAPWLLRLTQDAPWVSPHAQRLGAMPPELRHIAQTFTDDAWRLDTHAAPRAVGTGDMMVPDFTCIHLGGRRIHVELFHRWHRNALVTRVAQLRARPDCDVLLGIDKALTSQAAIARALEGADNVSTFIFNAFPTVTKLRASLLTCLAPRQSD